MPPRSHLRQCPDGNCLDSRSHRYVLLASARRWTSRHFVPARATVLRQDRRCRAVSLGSGALGQFGRTAAGDKRGVSRCLVVSMRGMSYYANSSAKQLSNNESYLVHYRAVRLKRLFIFRIASSIKTISSLVRVVLPRSRETE
jgi:hypothetical protein